MRNKKKPWWLALPIGIAVLGFGFLYYLYITEPPLVDEYPKNSIKNQFMLYNYGCCFFLEDFSIWLVDESGEEYPLFSHASPPYGKRFIADFPQDISGNVHAVVSFYYEYGTAGFVSFPIMASESFGALKKNGLLLIFGDGDLEVKSGRRETLFSYDKAPWADIIGGQRFEYTIADNLPAFTFEITKTDRQEMLEAGLLYTYQITVSCQEKPDLISQTFEFTSLIDGIRANSLFYEISFVDIDFDGYLDIEIEFGRGNANRMFQYFRWDNIEGQYEETPFFYMLYIWYHLFPDTNQIIAATHASAMSYGRDMYQLIDGKYVLLRYEYTEIVKSGEDDYEWVVHIVEDGRGEIFTETLTVDEYYNISPSRDNFLRYGTGDRP